MKFKLAFITVLLSYVSFFFSGCAAVSDLTTPSEMKIANIWEFIATVTESDYARAGQQMRGNITLTQDGSKISGTFKNSAGRDGTIKGSVLGGNVYFVVHQNKPCRGSFDGTGLLNDSGTEMEGIYKGKDCNGNLNSKFIAKAQSAE